MRRTFLFGFISAVLATLCAAQTPTANPSSTPPRKPEFEVASVREDKLGGLATSNIPLDRGNACVTTGEVFSATNQSLVTLLIFAYKIYVSEFYRGLMRSLPSWATTAKFDINAKAETKNPTREDMRLMLQFLLEDRFKLKAHREQRELPASGLYLTRPGTTGPQLKSHNPASSCSALLPAPAAQTPAASLVGIWPSTCGDGTEARTSKYRVREGGREMTMNAIADWLTGTQDSDRPILDHTGLNGTFDFVLEFDPESLSREAISSTPHDDFGPAFPEAVKEQLGLKLRKEQGSISIFVIDHVEYPTSN